jgi:hypothetical protein
MFRFLMIDFDVFLLIGRSIKPSRPMIGFEAGVHCTAQTPFRDLFQNGLTLAPSRSSLIRRWSKSQGAKERTT